VRKKYVSRAKGHHGRINTTIYKSLFNDVKNTPEFKKGYQAEVDLESFETDLKRDLKDPELKRLIKQQELRG
jgi:hypothetical protein